MKESKTLSAQLATNPLVAYVLPDEGHPHLTGTAGDVRPSLVTRDLSTKDIPETDGLVNLQVFLDGSNDGGIDAINAANKLSMWVRNVPYDNTYDPHDEGEPDRWHPGTWHFFGDVPTEAKPAPTVTAVPAPVEAAPSTTAKTTTATATPA